MTRPHLAAVTAMMLTVSCAVAPIGCAALGARGGSTDPDALNGRPWRLTHITDHPPAALEQARPTLEFDPETSRVAGHAGVNRYFGQYEVEGNALRLSGLGATRMAGPPAQMNLEHAYFEALEQVDRWRIDPRGRLELSTGHTVRLRFEADS